MALPEVGDLADLDIGEKIRLLRKSRQVTLKDLAERTGLSIGYLSQVERNLSSPSVNVLREIATALGVNISWFFEAPEQSQTGEERFIVRKNNRRQLRFRSGITDSLLTPNLNGQIELLLSRFEPGASSGEEPYTHYGEEAGVVMTGQLELWIGGDRFLLSEGDSFNFPSSAPHSYRNPGETESVVIWSITPPSY
ncbi:MAG: cupin domain-containing protein [Proteobacteria bacterium]|nr:cupin domain-containing protein [Pseudomonadota bacterium]